MSTVTRRSGIFASVLAVAAAAMVSQSASAAQPLAVQSAQVKAQTAAAAKAGLTHVDVVRRTPADVVHHFP